jgi:hypothetical protein
LRLIVIRGVRHTYPDWDCGRSFQVPYLSGLRLSGASGRFSFHNNPVSPLQQRDRDRRIAEFRSPLIQVCFGDPTGPGTRSSRKDPNLFGYNLWECLARGVLSSGNVGTRTKMSGNPTNQGLSFVRSELQCHPLPSMYLRGPQKHRIRRST